MLLSARDLASDRCLSRAVVRARPRLAEFCGRALPRRTQSPLEIASLVDVHQGMTGRFANLLKQGSRLLCVSDPTAMLPVAYRLDSDEPASAPRALGLSVPGL
jgi:hypothetical protein